MDFKITYFPQILGKQELSEHWPWFMSLKCYQELSYTELAQWLTGTVQSILSSCPILVTSWSQDECHSPRKRAHIQIRKKWELFCSFFWDENVSLEDPRSLTFSVLWPELCSTVMPRCRGLRKWISYFLRRHRGMWKGVWSLGIIICIKQLTF